MPQVDDLMPAHSLTGAREREPQRRGLAETSGPALRTLWPINEK